MKLGISTACLYPLETEKAFKTIAESGTPVTEIFFNASCELESSFVKELRAVQKEYGISVSSVHPTMSLAESFMLFSAYERRYLEALEQYKRYAEIVSELGGRYVIMHGGKPNGVLDNRGYFERFDKISDAVRENGGRLLQENVVHYRAGSLEVLKEMSEYLGDRAEFCLDVKQSVRGGYSPFEVVGILGNKIKHLHLSDNDSSNDCMLTGRGNFDFKALVGEMLKSGYKGDAVIEVYRSAFGEPQELFDSLKILQQKIF